MSLIRNPMSLLASFGAIPEVQWDFLHPSQNIGTPSEHRSYQTLQTTGADMSRKPQTSPPYWMHMPSPAILESQSVFSNGLASIIVLAVRH